jgi:molybdopterin-guanine dinucleotide biosynthesis protein A
MKNFGEAVILCGGKSTRMDFDKSLIKINGKYMIEIIHEKLAVCFEKVRLCGGYSERFSAFGLEIIEDKIAGSIGPAVGIYSALAQAATKYVFVAACDMPLIDPEHIELMKHLLENNASKPDALVPMHGGYIEPLYSFYSAAIAGKFKEEIEKGNNKIHEILKKCHKFYLDEKYSKRFDENLAMFTNINYMADLETFS